MRNFFLLILIYNVANALPYHWVQYTEQGINVRAITSDYRCPDIFTDNKEHQMTERYVFSLILYR